MPVTLHYNTIQTGAVSAFLEDNESGNESIRLLFYCTFKPPCYTPEHLRQKKQPNKQTCSTHQIKMLLLKEQHQARSDYSVRVRVSIAMLKPAQAAVPVFSPCTYTDINRDLPD